MVSDAEFVHLTNRILALERGSRLRFDTDFAPVPEVAPSALRKIVKITEAIQESPSQNWIYSWQGLVHNRTDGLFTDGAPNDAGYRNCRDLNGEEIAVGSILEIFNQQDASGDWWYIFSVANSYYYPNESCCDQSNFIRKIVVGSCLNATGGITQRVQYVGFPSGEIFADFCEDIDDCGELNCDYLTPVAPSCCDIDSTVSTILVCRLQRADLGLDLTFNLNVVTPGLLSWTGRAHLPVLGVNSADCCVSVNLRCRPSIADPTKNYWVATLGIYIPFAAADCTTGAMSFNCISFSGTNDPDGEVVSPGFTDYDPTAVLNCPVGSGFLSLNAVKTALNNACCLDYNVGSYQLTINK